MRFSWPVWFGYDENGELYQGHAVDISRRAVSFKVPDYRCPSLGSHVVTRFSFPESRKDNRFDMGRYLNWSEVIRIDDDGYGNRRVVLQLHKPLNDTPGETYPQTVQTLPRKSTCTANA